jgi:ion channel-forming bestrophin family protein
MYIKRNYGLWMTFMWSRKPFIRGFLYTLALAILHGLTVKYFDFDLALPWEPIGILGITVAFYLGFKNNSSYDRTWEARKIWGGIVNNSRSFGAGVRSFIRGPQEEEVQRKLIYRHIAWLTALRYQLRLTRSWEHIEDRVKGLYSPTICEEYFDQLDNEILHFISSDEFQSYKNKANMASQILLTQSMELQRLREAGYMEDFRHMELYRLIQTFYEDQGKSERIKNFPFPRQYASVALWTTLIFSFLIPFGLMTIFSRYGGLKFWLVVPFSALIIWIFFLMEKIGDYSENPFEGTYNDIPITSISRNIEIDLREMIQDKDIPSPIKDQDGFLM